MPSKEAGQPLTLDLLREAVAGIIGVEPEAITHDANLVHLGIDSLGIMRLVNLWRRAGIRVSSRELTANPTLAAWQRHTEDLRRAAMAEQMEPQPGDGLAADIGAAEGGS
jgi:aryl carrier-like protein